jgi:MYXO-CTERM domain-containing protein
MKTGSRLLLLLLAVAGSPRPAHAYVRYSTAGGLPFGWKRSCVSITAYPTDLPLMTRDQTRDAIAGAVAAWSKQDPTIGACSYLDLRLQVAAATDPQPASANDGMNVVAFRRDTWCPRPPNCYDPSALALTTVSARTSTGEIIDADIEINAVNWSWADVTRNAPTGTEQDLQNAVTHEAGHLIGLDHTCTLGGGTPPTDQNGNPIPDCANASAAVMETTMFPSANALDTNKRTLAPDDQMGVCGSYPLASDPMICPAPTTPDGGAADASTALDAATPPDAGVDAEPPRPDARFDTPPLGDGGSTTIMKAGCGCEVSGLATPAPGGLLAAAIALVVLRRRRR